MENNLRIVLQINYTCILEQPKYSLEVSLRQICHHKLSVNTTYKVHYNNPNTFFFTVSSSICIDLRGVLSILTEAYYTLHELIICLVRKILFLTLYTKNCIHSNEKIPFPMLTPKIMQAYIVEPLEY